MSTRFKPYPAYKGSGVQWLGGIPVQWNVVRSDAVLEYKKVQARRESFSGKRVFHYSIPAIQETGDGREEEGSEIDSDKIALSGDELLVSKLNPRKGCVLISKMHELPVVCSTEFVPLTAKGCDLRFAFYLYASQPVRELISATVQSVTRSHQRANPSDIAKIWLAFPTQVEQQAIASMLDRETGRIDALVKKKERLIELLQEKRTALISHVVTQGLDPNAPKKDSGIPWLGQIPKHWEVRKFGQVAFFQEGPGLRNWQFTDLGVRVICVTNITEAGIDFTGYQKFISTEEYSKSYRHFTVKIGDLLLSSSGNSWGKVADYQSKDMAILNTSTIRVNANSDGNIGKEHLKWILQSDNIRSQLGWMMTGSCQPNFGPSHLNKVVVPVPPGLEQSAIAVFLDQETAKLDALVGKVRTAIDRLQEYRTALISAAVTGQIDVRMEAL